MKRITLILLALATLLAGGCGSAPGVQPDVLHGTGTGVDAGAWALVPAGEFLMGQHEHETVITYDFRAMVTPVTNAQYAQYLNEAVTKGAVRIENNQVVGYYPGDVYGGGRHEKVIEAGDWLHVPIADPDSRLVFDGSAFAAMPGYEDHPATVVTWFGAKAYCEFHGWRLPTEAEWEKAARGVDGRPFPWGDEIVGSNANYYGSGDPYEAAGPLGSTSPVGFYNGKSYAGYATIDSPSPYGLYDMAGNVWEWTANVYDGTHYRYLRGGSRADYAYDLRVWTRNSAEPDYYGPSVGFRCVSQATR